MRKFLSTLLLCLLPFSALGETELVLSFVGDCALADQYKYRASDTSFTTVATASGLDYPFSGAYDLFSQDDLTLANCEGTFTLRRLKKGAKAMSLSAPPEFAEVFALGAVDAVNLSNNHSRDFGAEGLTDTKAALTDVGIAFFGGQDTLILERSGIKIGLCGRSYPLTDAKMRRFRQDIAELRAAGCQLVIASAHSGKEDCHTPNLEQRTCFPELLEMGADIVYGHSAHVLHPIEVTEKGVILYSLGNFVFGANPRPRDADTAVIQLRMLVDDDGQVSLDGLRALPFLVHRNSDYRPHPLESDSDRQRVFEKLVFPADDKRDSGLPASFLETGEMNW